MRYVILILAMFIFCDPIFAGKLSREKKQCGVTDLDIDGIDFLLGQCEKHGIPEVDCDKLFSELLTGSIPEIRNKLSAYHKNRPAPNLSANAGDREENKLNLNPKDLIPPSIKLKGDGKADLSKLSGNPDIMKKFQEFAELMKDPRNALIEIRRNQGRWKLENVDGKDFHGRSVRLNQGYRVIFTISDDQKVIIHQIRKDTITHR